MSVKLKRSAKQMFDIYNKQRVYRSAAAMSYFITISLFPILICVYAILGSLHLSATGLTAIWSQIIPPDVSKVITNYLRYVGGNASTLMVIVGATVALSSASSVFRTIMTIMADIQGKSRYTGILWFIYSLVVSLGLLVVIYISGLIILTGEWFLNFLESRLRLAYLLTLWQYVRFGVLFILLLAVIYLVYLITAPKNTKFVKRLPGAAIASVLLVAVSAVFSRLVTMSVNYPIVYGSLASFIILMFWIYICSNILIMGNVFNIVVYQKT